MSGTTAASGAPAVLELRRVSKSYPGDPPTTVLHDVDLTVVRGELVAVVGPSGSGKSTLMNIVGTLDRPTSGSVVVAGHHVEDLDDADLSALRASAIGFVFQQFFLLPGMTTVDNVADGLLYRGRPGAGRLRRRARSDERRVRATEALRRVGLGHRLHHPPEKLSGGERQRVAIARALVGQPAVVLADEPTGNLDTRSSDSIMALLHELNDEGATIVVITHDRDIAASLPRQVALRDGVVEHDSGGPHPVDAHAAGRGS
jgi:putative ABC transport system ATP-binding protein